MVLTKDLSRLGRNNALVAHYTEIYFPENYVRYIAVTDGIDTFRSDNEIMPFKSVVNEYYARDISRKTRSAFKIKAQNGEFTGSMPPYGYKKDQNNKHRLVPDGFERSSKAGAAGFNRRKLIYPVSIKSH